VDGAGVDAEDRGRPKAGEHASHRLQSTPRPMAARVCNDLPESAASTIAVSATRASIDEANTE
jgi:hypothetical protein